MKTSINNISLITIAALLININVFASAFSFSEEAYIDDIPFDTHLVVEHLTAGGAAILFESEAYIDDIPFSTAQVAAEYAPEQEDTLTFIDEAYIDDIPFNTEEIVTGYNYKKAMDTEFELADESYIDDIPFDTFTVCKEAGKKDMPLYYSVVVTPLFDF